MVIVSSVTTPRQVVLSGCLTLRPAVRRDVLDHRELADGLYVSRIVDDP
jgi:hypothetical protein